MSDYSLLIDGKLVAGDATLDVINPATEELAGTCSRASEAQLDQATIDRHHRCEHGLNDIDVVIDFGDLIRSTPRFIDV